MLLVLTVSLCKSVIIDLFVAQHHLCVVGQLHRVESLERRKAEENSNTTGQAILAA
jgi:hypothetical protein